ncbi:MAG: hypothetical protein RL272_669 [Candidatus Parcubacteria bacterium]|jgi:peroxiredoxin Q/BCP
MLNVGDKAPDFTLPDQEGKEHALSEYKGDWVLLYFYPKDDTPGCTAEACGIRDRFEEYGDEEISVLGVSTDPVKSHAKFAAKYALPFTLLSDAEKKVVAAYGVWSGKKFMGREYMGTNRWSYLIDPKGKIAKVYDKVRPADHAAQVLADVRELKAQG